MGIYFDFFRAEHDDAAIETRMWDAGPCNAGSAGGADLDGCRTKGVFPDPHLEQLLAHAARVPYERGPRTSDRLWPPADTPPPLDETSIWFTDPSIERLSTRVRDALADIDESRAADLAESWLVDLGAGFTADQARALIVELSSLGRRARDAGEELYCWSAM